MSSRCLVRLQNEWVHHSQRDASVVLRWFGSTPAEKAFDLSDEAQLRAYAELVGDAPRLSLRAARDLLGGQPDLPSLRIEQTEAWRAACQRLADLAQEPAVPAALAGPAALASAALSWAETIPQTPLRQFYNFLRMFSASRIHEEIARYVSGQAGCAKSLQNLFVDSVRQFARYKNGAEEFCPPRKGWSELPLTGRDARNLVARLSPDRWPDGVPVRSEVGQKLDFQPVSYEVSFLRATGHAHYDNGEPILRFGGIDLLLESLDGDLPIVAEIKAPGDTNLFLALVQALMHAVELTTESQFARLREHHGLHFKDLELAPARCDVYLIYFRAENLDDRPPLFKEATIIADHLLSDPAGLVAQKIRRIAFLEAIPATEPLGFECHHLSPCAGPA